MLFIVFFRQMHFSLLILKKMNYSYLSHISDLASTYQNNSIYWHNLLFFLSICLSYILSFSLSLSVSIFLAYPFWCIASYYHIISWHTATSENIKENNLQLFISCHESAINGNWQDKCHFSKVFWKICYNCKDHDTYQKLLPFWFLSWVLEIKTKVFLYNLAYLLFM